MMFVAVVFTALWAMTTQVLALPNELAARGFTEAAMQWTGSITGPDGPNVTFAGTVEQIAAQIQAANPDYDLTFPDDADAVNASSKEIFMPADNNEIKCGIGGGGPARSDKIRNGMGYLRRFQGVCAVSPGPYVCVRVSCSWNSAIWWCNDKTDSLMGSCNIVADLSQYVVDACTYGPNPEILLTWGQVFSSDHTNNVYCAKDSC
ncbi:hypothetical protein F4780DRAFT_687494 [Xylariomycetidae sp. FL0641]|nr:hypothetical protein F4780DRAFT_687494 [Xylariomycetidae sp. FL0641]